MTDKALKQYIYEKYDLKVKRVKLGGPYYTLSYQGDWGCGDGEWRMTTPWDDYGYLLHNRLFSTLANLVDVLEAAKGKTKEKNNGD